MKVLITAKLDADQKQHYENSYPEVDFVFSETEAETKNHLTDAEVMVTYGSDANEESIKQAKNLKWLMVLSAGVENLPLEDLKRRNVMLTNANGIHSIQMAEYAISMLLSVTRNERVFMKQQENHEWNMKTPIDEITAKRMLVVGAGAIGKEVARLAKAFRMHTIGVSRSGTDKDYFDEMYKQQDIDVALPHADFIVSILPSTKETSYFYTTEHFSKMQKHAVFLNMGRGDAVSSDVLLEALNSERIAAAVLDVFEEEPLPSNHPFWDHEKIWITPHMSGKSPYYLERALEIFEDNLNKYVEDKSSSQSFRNVIDLERGY